MSDYHSYVAHRVRHTEDYRKNGTSTVQSVNTVDSVGTDLLNSSDNPDFQVNIAKRIDAGSDYLRKRELKLELLKAFATCKYNNSYYTGNVSLYPSQFSHVDYTANDTGIFLSNREIALKRLKRKLSVKEGRFDALIPIAEAKDLKTTVQSMVSLTGDFLNGVVNFKRGLKGNPKKAVSNLSKFVSEAWLTYSFGIKPTVSDFEGLVDSISSRLERPRSIRELGGQTYDFQDTPQVVSNYIAGSFLSPDSSILVKTTGRFHHKMVWIYTAGRYIDLQSSSHNITRSDQFGLNWSKIVPAAWELCPYSWLVDYFVTVGDFVDNVFESPANNTIYNYLTVFQKSVLHTSTDFAVGKYVANPTKVVTSSPFRDIEIVRRTRLAQLPHASLRIKTLDEIGANAVNKLSNLFALSSPAFRRSLR